MKSKIHEHQKNIYSIVSKKSLLILGILFSLVASSCCSSGDNSSEGGVVAGQWKLINVSGSFAGVDSDFEPGVITWNFNPTTQTVTVVNNNTDENKTDIFETGIYNYQIVPNENPELCSEILKIDNIEMGCFGIVDGKLKIDQAFADGYMITLQP